MSERGWKGDELEKHRTDGSPICTGVDTPTTGIQWAAAPDLLGAQRLPRHVKAVIPGVQRLPRNVRAVK
jgi:hypothetical protein